MSAQVDLSIPLESTTADVPTPPVLSSNFNKSAEMEESSAGGDGGGEESEEEHLVDGSLPLGDEVAAASTSTKQPGRTLSLHSEVVLDAQETDLISAKVLACKLITPEVDVGADPNIRTIEITFTVVRSLNLSAAVSKSTKPKAQEKTRAGPGLFDSPSSEDETEQPTPKERKRPAPHPAPIPKVETETIRPSARDKIYTDWNDRNKMPRAKIDAYVTAAKLEEIIEGMSKGQVAAVCCLHECGCLKDAMVETRAHIIAQIEELLEANVEDVRRIAKALGVGIGTGRKAMRPQLIPRVAMKIADWSAEKLEEELGS